MWSKWLLVILFSLALGDKLETETLEVEPLSLEEIEDNRETVRSMFSHAHTGYMRYAFPADELLPLSCKGKNTLGGYALTYIDSLDTLAIMGMKQDFEDGIEWVSKNLHFDLDVPVSIFETNIRILGGLLSSHLLASELSVPNYTGKLLELAQDLADRLLPAFQTESKIPMRMVNLKRGMIEEEESQNSPGCFLISSNKKNRISTAEAGSFLLEFGILSHLTGDKKYKETAMQTIEAIYKLKLPQGIVGSQIDPRKNRWITTGDGKFIGIGSGVDSFYEYLLKGYLLFRDPVLLSMFDEFYEGIYKHLKQGPWYISVDIDDFAVIDPIFVNLDAYWPGVQALRGKDLKDASETLAVYHTVWQKHGLLPEKYDIVSETPYATDMRYQLRPEMAESMFYLYNATKNDLWLILGIDIIQSIEDRCKTRCGYAAVNVMNMKKLDSMESFFLGETTKYLYLLYDSDNFLLKKRGVVFNTEAHPLWLP